MALSKFTTTLAVALLSMSTLAHADVMQEERDLYLAKRGEVGQLKARNQFQLTGGFEVVGQASAAQVFSRGKLVPCTINRDAYTNAIVLARATCDDSQRIYVPLTDGVTQGATAVNPGLYLFGYENSLYPGYVVVNPGQTTRITLSQIQVPAGGTVKIYRDLTSLDEQRKTYFTHFAMKKSFFKYGEWAFGDLYIQKVGNNNAPPSLNYDFCEQASLPELTKRGERICRSWNQPSFMAMMEMFDFRNDQKFIQWEVRRPGKAYAYRFNRLLVAKATTASRAQFVNVLPGVYALEVVDGKGVAKVQAGIKLGPTDPYTGQLATAFGQLPDPSVLALSGNYVAPKPAAVDLINDPLIAANAGLAVEGDEPQLQPGETCVSAKMWRTELRAHCKADTQEGCNRQTARLCEPMVSDLQ